MRIFTKNMTMKHGLSIPPKKYGIGLSLVMLSMCGLSYAGLTPVKWEKPLEIPVEKVISAEFATPDGNISIQPQTDPKRTTFIDVKATFSISKKNMLTSFSEAEIAQLKEQLDVVAERDSSGEKLVIHSVIPKDLQNKINVAIDLNVKVPSSLAVQANSSDGNIAIDGIKAAVDAKSSDGNIAIQNITGTVKVITSDGNLALENCAGIIEGKTSDGDVAVENCKAGTNPGEGKITVITSDGNVALVNCSGVMDAKTSDGDIAIEKSKGSVHAISSDGSITIQDADSEITAQTSEGDVKVSFIAPPGKECSFKSNEGSIDISLPSASKLNISLKTEEGSINLDRNAFTGKVEKHSAEGTFNGGGVALQARTGEGNIAIHLK